MQKVATLTSVAIIVGTCALLGAMNARKSEIKKAQALKPVIALKEPSAAAEDLPNVLLIGDSISIGYTAATREILGGFANVYRIPENGGATSKGLAHLEEWLEGRPWAVIHVNFGLHDLFLQRRRYLPWSPRAPRVQPATYAINLRAIVHRLKATGAKVIIATTTPVPSGARHRKAGSEILYNEAAIGVAVREGVALNDLHSMGLLIAGRAQVPNDVHFTAEGYASLAAQVAGEICRQLYPTRASSLQMRREPRSDCPSRPFEW
jgi:hypothetical protein